jgi:hypothetical protein
VAYDIHIARTQKIAERTRSVISLTSEQHSAIFSRGGVAKELFPLMWKMSNYYKDASFSQDSLPGLIVELEKAKASARKTEASSAIDQLVGAAKRAFEEKSTLFCFCD